MNQHDPAVAAAQPRLFAEAATIGYDNRVISKELSVSIPDRSFTVIVGANACGKSTLLRALSRLIRPSAGRVVLDGQTIGSFSAKEVARRPRPLAADLQRSRRHHCCRPHRPQTLPAPEAAAPVVA